MPSTAYRTPVNAGASDFSRCQKPAPLSGGSPSPKVLVTTSTSRAADRSASARSSMFTHCAPPSRSASRAAKSSAVPVCDAHNTSGPSSSCGRTVGSSDGGREFPASSPLIHCRTSLHTGAESGSTGTSDWASTSPLKKPDT